MVPGGIPSRKYLGCIHCHVLASLQAVGSPLKRGKRFAVRTVSLEISFPRCVGKPKRVSSLLVTRLPTSEGGSFFSPPGLQAQDRRVSMASIPFHANRLRAPSQHECRICFAHEVMHGGSHLTMVQSSPLDLRYFSDCRQSSACQIQ